MNTMAPALRPDALAGRNRDHHEGHHGDQHAAGVAGNRRAAGRVRLAAAGRPDVTRLILASEARAWRPEGMGGHGIHKTAYPSRVRTLAICCACNRVSTGPIRTR